MQDISFQIEHAVFWTEPEAAKYAVETSNILEIAGPVEREDDEDWIFLRDSLGVCGCIHVRIAFALWAERLCLREVENVKVARFQRYETAEFAMEPELIMTKFGLSTAAWSQGEVNPSSFSPSDLVWMTV